MDAFDFVVLIICLVAALLLVGLLVADTLGIV
jgi:hypothetical protein